MRLRFTSRNLDALTLYKVDDGYYYDCVISKNVALRRFRAAIFAVEKPLNIAYSDYVSVALGIQHAMRMRLISTCGLPALQYFFPRYVTNGTIFGKNVIEHKISVLIFSTKFA